MYKKQDLNFKICLPHYIVLMHGLKTFQKLHLMTLKNGML